MHQFHAYCFVAISHFSELTVWEWYGFNFKLVESSARLIVRNTRSYDRSLGNSALHPLDPKQQRERQRPLNCLRMRMQGIFTTSERVYLLLRAHSYILLLPVSFSFFFSLSPSLPLFTPFSPPAYSAVSCFS